MIVSRSRWLVAVLVVLAMAAPASAVAPGCRSVCRGAAAGWNKTQIKRCVTQCTNQCRRSCGKKSCQGGAASNECNEGAADCTGRCAAEWASGREGADRGACQAACNSCRPAGRELCIEAGTSGDRVARCCGGDSGRACCGQPGFTNLCCGDGLGCCSDPVVPGSSSRMPACVDLQTTRRHCGQCDNACPSNAECCAGKCADLQTDPLNCGRCGRLCATDQACENGDCVEACSGDQLLCKASARACCSPDATCCAGADNAYEGNWCWTPQRVTTFTGRPAGAIICCSGTFPPPGDGKSYTWACPATDSCCIGYQGIDCCPPGTQCRPGSGHCEVAP
jgi:hypothetical protein